MLNSEKELHAYIQKTSRIILSGLQDSYYPIPYSVQDSILTSYMKMIHSDEYFKNENVPANPEESAAFPDGGASPLPDDLLY